MPPGATQYINLFVNIYAIALGWTMAFFASPGSFAFDPPPPGENRIFLCMRISSERLICAFLLITDGFATIFSPGCRSPPLISICLPQTNKSKLEEIK